MNGVRVRVKPAAVRVVYASAEECEDAVITLHGTVVPGAGSYMAPGRAAATVDFVT